MDTSIKDILLEASAQGASDVHITVGIPPKFRINGKLVSIDHYGKILPADTKRMADEITDDHQKAMFEKHGQYDMSFSIMGTGRFRVNLFKQRGSVEIALRVVAQEVPGADVLGIPDAVSALYSK